MKVVFTRKRRYSLLSILALLIMSISCTTGCHFDAHKKNEGKQSTKKESADEKYIQIITDALVSNNTEPLYKELSKELQQKQGTKKRLDDFVRFVDTKQLKVERISSSTSWWHPTDKKYKSGNYMTTVKANPGYLVKDENNTEYFITLLYYPNYKECLEKTGINEIEIHEEDAQGNYVRTLKIAADDEI